ncbi:MAG: pyridoxal phosphate-dependent aminotransferase [Candidatus Lokiarchaeota archaeon]|nr:pyridoxal phosphate-dependent aminotransferase [Candidatus Lokiarchaeota archaeon]
MKYNFNRFIDRRDSFSLKWSKEALQMVFKKDEDDLLPLWVADMDFECPKPVVDALKKEAEGCIYGYNWHGTPKYLEAVTGWMDRRHQWKVDPKWIQYSPGIVPAINMMVQTFSNIGDKVIVQPPVYYPFFSAVTANGRRLLLNQLRYENQRYTFDFEDFEEKAKDPLTKIFILCSPHNPVGRVWTREELKKIGDICLEHDILIISDEIHHDLILPGNKHTVFSTISEEFEQKTIVCTAPSKTFNLAGLQVSNIIIPNEKMRQSFIHTIVHKNGIGIPNSFGIVAMIAAYNEGEEWLEQVLKYIDSNFHFLQEFVTNEIPDVKCIEPEGTYLAWLDFNSLGLNDEELKNIILNEAKIALDEGKLFGVGGEGFQRVNVACPKSILEETMQRIKKVVDQQNRMNIET